MVGVPTVFTGVSDPVGACFIDSLAPLFRIATPDPATSRFEYIALHKLRLEFEACRLGPLGREIGIADDSPPAVVLAQNSE